MIDAKIVEPLEDGINGDLCLTAHNDAFLLLLNGQLFNVELHEELLIVLFDDAP